MNENENYLNIIHAVDTYIGLLHETSTAVA